MRGAPLATIVCIETIRMVWINREFFGRMASESCTFLAKKKHTCTLYGL